ncbi:30S ribosomal protein S20 [Loigolactobacillus backii]|uniref:Small ribosomal subunit protein bS20 n=1 Tax=Loigolactobacillus backii TaxID=375175 RepID=A0A192H405_9LACO|nr:30S ribosomal protein S20 [Loigolactobacillus backii]ANK59700.1 30S ribosomal protein S20 [Loigolactobacillus backii]ANK63100.1 30S ribosomal protein S20 [Loigolactobacillus backii]ANK64696.1 30S ribosomal protein S20 [Loigolactobacillus backii]ANK66855.1 30S ribosomal protein S20 [Loigolactobacillus backii]ANK69892.1 30S ribosomal protein S20 [Loigolactobacillus backii]
MPNLKSAIKRARNNEKANAHNVSQISAMRSTVKQFEKAQAAGGADNSEELYRAAVRSIDMAKSKGLVHANKAARDKSRLSKLLAK